MHITFRKSTATAVIGATLLLLAAVGGALAAAPAVDTETTDTASTSALNDGDTVTSFNASDTNISTLQADYDSDNPGIKIVDPETGDTIKTVTNSSDPGYFTETDATADYYNTTFTEADFAAVPMDASENKTVTLRIINNTNVSSPDTTNITVYLENTDKRAVVTASETDPDTSTEETDPVLPWRDAETRANIDADSVGINGSNTTVYVVYTDDDAAAPYETAAANKSGVTGDTFATDYSDGDRIRDHIVRVNDTPYAVFSATVAEDVPEDTTYATYTTVDGEPAHAVTLGDDYDSETAVDVETTGNDELSFFERVETEGVGVFGLSLTAVAGATLVVVGRPRITRDSSEPSAADTEA
jgi:hypothetical protein